jgi:hypothetical protein
MFHGRAQIRSLATALAIASLALLTVVSSVLAGSGGVPFPR